MTQEHMGPRPHSQEPGFLRTSWRTLEAPLGATSTSEGTTQNHRVKAVNFRDKPDGHPDQMPNILACQDMIENSPPWLKPVFTPQSTQLA